LASVKVSAQKEAIGQIAEAMGMERNGHLVEYLTELELAGFVSKDSGINPCTRWRRLFSCWATLGLRKSHQGYCVAPVALWTDFLI
jgi:hypothetical protein